MRVTLLSHNAREADAIGNQLAGKVRFLNGHGWEVRLYVESMDRLHPGVAACARRQTAAGLWKNPADRQFLEEADLVLAEYGMAYGLLDLLPALAGGKPRVVIDYYGITPPDVAPPELRRSLEQSQRQRGLVWCADLVLVHSRSSAKELVEATGYPRERIRQIPCFADLEGFCQNAPVRQVREPLELQDARVLLFVGRLAMNKRVPVLIETIALLRDLTPPTHAVIIGDESDVYEVEANACRKLAAERGVAERVHFLGRADEPTLRAWYRSADVFVMPSVHEGYCLPVVEAMACGLPVIAARAGALPETVADAGLMFRADDPADLARQVRKLGNQEAGVRGQESGVEQEAQGSVAVVAPRYGDDFAGGAERSLRIIAKALKHAGCRVEVFTTCNRHESQWANHLPAGTEELDGIAVHRFPIDAHDRERHLASLETLRRRHGRVSPGVEAEYLTSSLHSAALVRRLEERAAEFDAIIVGPYLFGLTWQVAGRLGPRVLGLPCFHDEPPVYLSAFHEVHRETAGILYHSEEEKHFAEAELGINHPNAEVIGTFLEPPERPGDPERGRARSGKDYVVYCGRYSPEKGVDRLLQYAEHYAVKQPGRFRFVFMGQADGLGDGLGDVPARPWLLDLGFVTEETKRDVLAGARALVQLSKNESLSLVILEAWSAGVPVIGHRDCAVIRGQIERSGGGRVIGNENEFAATLDSLWADTERWRAAGLAGRRYVAERYASQPKFTAPLLRAVKNMCTPLVEQMRSKGFQRAAQLGDQVWQERYAALLAEVIDQPRGPGVMNLELTPQTNRKSVPTDSGLVLVPVRVTNQGTLPAVVSGPACTQIVARVTDSRGEPHRFANGRPRPTKEKGARLRALLPPGQSTVAVVPVAVPPEPGTYRVSFSTDPVNPSPPNSFLELCVTDQETGTPSGVETPFLDQVERALAEAGELQVLPDDYRDVSQGILAGLKRRIKHTLLHQFRKSYVDVLSRQQTAFNDRVVLAIAQMRDCCSALGQVTARTEATAHLERLTDWMKQLRKGQRQLQRAQAKLARRLKALERAFGLADQR